MNVNFLLGLAGKILPMLVALVDEIDGNAHPETKKKAVAAKEAVQALAEHKPSGE